VVDDEEPLLKLALRTLEGLGYAASGFPSSAAALEAFQADPGMFDAVVTDERMPEVCGSELIGEVCAIRGAIPILLISGYVGGQVTALALEAGADEVLKKPLLERDLAISLARVLRNRGGTPDAPASAHSSD
jgi:DNA-binding response OmpR family regulator